MDARSSRRQKLWRSLYGAGVLAFLGFAGWFVFGKGGLWETYRLRRQWQLQAAQALELEAMRDSLNAYLAALQAGDPLALERAAREHGLVAPNETIYEVKIDTTK